MKKLCLTLVLTLLLLCAISAACADTPVSVAEKGTGITVIPASQWAEKFPEVYASYEANAENDQVVEYTEEHPIIKTIYEGYGFAKYYGSARGHYYTVSDLLATGRPHALANCFTCKTADFTVLTLNDGDSAYSVPFEDLDAASFEAVGCFTCHANSPGGQITVTHTYLSDALGDDFGGVKAETLACAQCHVEYYFAPEGKMTSLPYRDLASKDPEAIYDYYENLGFSDYTNPRTGVQLLKAQHPEFETFMGAGSVHASMFTCADCHMAKETAADGKTYLSHKYVSPLESETIQATCAGCHADLAGFVRGIQEPIKSRTQDVGVKLETLTNRLADAVASGSYTDEQLTTVRALNRKGQWYWDFVFVENSDGAHNSSLTKKCLDRAEAFIDAALEILDGLIG